ncbi:DinB family protein [Aquimarina sp. 2201CG5-10]|uniref:DinB family protein n=1 Tax=Aquimarina callyspongiae TaxID=3098150 RepID=UPI002AB390B7|nr:DinB family protein [Aquimarina sp. 2201CG5-10]MDY8137782.1 DinB family protein [Aquimarina sp. 2201CG5-10]
MEIKDIHSFLQYYSRVKSRSRRLFEHIPKEHIEWTYQKGKFTIGDIIRHLALTERWMYVENTQLKPSLYSGCGENFAEGYQETIRLYDQLHKESVEILSKLTPDNLLQRCETPGGTKISVWKLLRAMVEHEIHHRGVLYTYLGILQVNTPPIFGLTSEEVIQNSENTDIT